MRGFIQDRARGEFPSPEFLRNSTSPRKWGEVTRNARASLGRDDSGWIASLVLAMTAASEPLAV